MNSDLADLGTAVVAWLDAATTWHNLPETEQSWVDHPAASAYWQTKEHLEFTLRRLGFLPPEGDGEEREQPTTLALEATNVHSS